MIPLDEMAIQELRNGNLREANRILGTPYYITGLVIKGNRIGRTIGFPTANIDPSPVTPLYLPKGVYAVFVIFPDRQYPGIANIGIRPTLNLGLLTIEVNIFDFNEDLYGTEITIQFVERIRDEKKFPGLDALKAQIIKDKVVAEKILGTWHHPDPGA